jgi:AcrR family transcriptional regulator
VKKNKREENKERSKEQILNAALELFSSKGYGSTTLDMIAEKASLSKGLTYLYFESKEALLYAILERHFERKKDMKSFFKTDYVSFPELLDDLILFIKAPFREGMQSEICLEIRLFMTLMLQSETKILLEERIERFQRELMDNHFQGLKMQFAKFGIKNVYQETEYIRLILFGYMFYKLCLGNDFPEEEIDKRIREIFLFRSTKLF